MCFTQVCYFDMVLAQDLMPAPAWCQPQIGDKAQPHEVEIKPRMDTPHGQFLLRRHPLMVGETSNWKL